MRGVIDAFQKSSFVSDATAYVVFGGLFLVLVAVLIHWWFYMR